MSTDSKSTSKYTKSFYISVALSLVMLFITLFINFYAGLYADEHVSNPVTDIVLSNTRVYDVDWFFTYGAVIFWLFIIYLCVTQPQRIPFTAKSISLFVIIRAVFINLTHLAPFPTHTIITSTNILGKFTFGGDLFFSGHTGLPFLMALIFWNNKYLRLLFIVTSLLFGAVVLLGHLHYSIDVAAAFFITHTIYYMAERFFKNDRTLFLSGFPRTPGEIVS